MKSKTELSEGILRAARHEDAEVFDITQIDPNIPSFRKGVKAFWMDIDTKEDLEKAEKLLIKFASLLTFIVSFMDGVDGKLSRVKISSSKTGKMEHAFDFLFEHSWYIALTFYLAKIYGIIPIMLATLIHLFDGFSHYSQRAFEEVKKEYQLVDYGEIERTFRKFDGRKNIYIILILFGVLLNMPFYSLIIITFWSCISAGFYCLRAMKHLHMMDRKEHL